MPDHAVDLRNAILRQFDRKVGSVKRTVLRLVLGDECTLQAKVMAPCTSKPTSAKGVRRIASSGWPCEIGPAPSKASWETLRAMHDIQQVTQIRMQ